MTNAFCAQLRILCFRELRQWTVTFIWQSRFASTRRSFRSYGSELPSLSRPLRASSIPVERSPEEGWPSLGVPEPASPAEQEESQPPWKMVVRPALSQGPPRLPLAYSPV